MITTFNKPTALFAALFMVALGICLPLEIIYPPHWSPYYGLPIEWPDYFLFPLALFIFLSGCKILYEIAFQRARAIWLEGDYLVWLDTYFHRGIVRIERSKITSIDLKNFGLFQTPRIVIAMSNGNSISISLKFLSDPPELILAHLKASINLAHH